MIRYYTWWYLGGGEGGERCEGVGGHSEEEGEGGGAADPFKPADAPAATCGPRPPWLRCIALHSE